MCSAAHYLCLMSIYNIILAALPFYTFMAIGTVTPGPNNFMLAASGMNFGYKRTLPHIFGIMLGFATLLLICMQGVGHIYSTYPQILLAMKIGGATYLVYLAYKIAFAKAVKSSGTDTENEKARPLKLHEAALFQFINPKAWAMNLAAVSSFMPADADLSAQLFIAISLVTIIGYPGISAWALFGEAMAKLFTSEKYQRRINIALGLLLIATIPMMVLI